MLVYHFAGHYVLRSVYVVDAYFTFCLSLRIAVGACCGCLFVILLVITYCCRCMLGMLIFHSACHYVLLSVHVMDAYFSFCLSLRIAVGAC